MTHTLTLDLPAGIWLTSNLRLHWRPESERTASIRLLARHAARGLPVIERCRVTAAIGYPTAARADPSNAAPTVKACLDGITDARGGWADDDSEHVVSVAYVRGPETGRRGVYRVGIEIEEVAI